jgi:translation initiation factor 3 subunit C
MFTYFTRSNDPRCAAPMALLCVEHMYYKHDTIAVAVNRANAFGKAFGRYADLHPACLGKDSSPTSKGRDAKVFHPAALQGTPNLPLVEYNPTEKLQDLCKFIFKHGDDRSRTRALLCSVFHHALHNRYYHARDLFLISHVQDSIEKADTETQILYNRALVTLGLSAFRQGLINKAYECLSGICSGRVRDLLAQGLSKYFDKDPEQEKVEKRRQVPYHMHINPDLLECVHLVCGMLLELPVIDRPVTHQYQVSKFRRYMNSYRQQLFTGPPENTRDLVMAAAKALLVGEWKKASDLLVNCEVWNLIPSDGAAKVKEMLAVKLKEEAVRIFLLNYGTHYESISLEHLCTMFEMSDVTTRKVVSKMIHSKEISGAWEQPEDILVLYKIDPSTLQSLCQVVADKVAYLVESNERLLDPLGGSYGYKDDWQSRDPRKYETGGRAKNGAWKSHGGRYPPVRAAQSGRGRGGRGHGGRDRKSQNYQQGGDKQRSQNRPSGQQGAVDAHQAPKSAASQFRWGTA